MEEMTTGNIKSITFQLNNEEYAMPVDSIGSIERMMPITRVPGTPDYVKGVLNLRGVVTPLIDLRVRFGFDKREYNDSTRIIIIQYQNMDIGFIVDATNDVVDIPKESIESTPEVVGSAQIDYIDGVAQYNNRLLILLNIDKILADESSANSLDRQETLVER